MGDIRQKGAYATTNKTINSAYDARQVSTVPTKQNGQLSSISLGKSKSDFQTTTETAFTSGSSAQQNYGNKNVAIARTVSAGPTVQYTPQRGANLQSQRFSSGSSAQQNYGNNNVAIARTVSAGPTVQYAQQRGGNLQSQRFSSGSSAQQNYGNNNVAIAGTVSAGPTVQYAQQRGGNLQSQRFSSGSSAQQNYGNKTVTIDAGPTSLRTTRPGTSKSNVYMGSSTRSMVSTSRASAANEKALYNVKYTRQSGGERRSNVSFGTNRQTNGSVGSKNSPSYGRTTVTTARSTGTASSRQRSRPDTSKSNVYMGSSTRSMVSTSRASAANEKALYNVKYTKRSGGERRSNVSFGTSRQSSVSFGTTNRQSNASFGSNSRQSNASFGNNNRQNYGSKTFTTTVSSIPKVVTKVVQNTTQRDWSSVIRGLRR